MLRALVEVPAWEDQPEAGEGLFKLVAEKSQDKPQLKNNKRKREEQKEVKPQEAPPSIESTNGKKRRRGKRGGKKVSPNKTQDEIESSESAPRKPAAEQPKQMKRKRQDTSALTTNKTTTTTTAQPKKAKNTLPPSQPKAQRVEPNKSSLASETVVGAEHTGNLLPLRKKKKRGTKNTQPTPDGLSALQQKLKARLKGSRFRWINEQFYTISGEEAETLFKEQPDMFQEYHRGFQSQVAHWPVAPVDVFIAQLKKLPTTLKVADMGCGDAKIAQCALQTVYSFDLVANNKWVTPCNIAHVPLENKSVDIVIFCLSLMGTNFMDFLVEAHRILVNGGNLKIAEVKSRFSNFPKFLKALEKLGFDVIEQDDKNKMFVMLELKKTSRKSIRIDSVKLRPCKYKKR